MILQSKIEVNSALESNHKLKIKETQVLFFFIFFFIQFLFSFIKMLPQIKLNNWGINIVNSLSFNCSTWNWIDLKSAVKPT